jgi:hypothetical protein
VDDRREAFPFSAATELMPGHLGRKPEIVKVDRDQA